MAMDHVSHRHGPIRNDSIKQLMKYKKYYMREITLHSHILLCYGVEYLYIFWWVVNSDLVSLYIYNIGLLTMIVISP